MAVPVEIRATRIRAIGEPWDRVGFKLTPGHDSGPKEAAQIPRSSMEEGKLEDTGGRNASFPGPELPERP